MGTKIHKLTIYPILENCKFWDVTVLLYFFYFLIFSLFLEVAQYPYFKSLP